VLVIWVLTGVLVYAAIERFAECLAPNPVERVNGKLMFIVACIGLVVNLILMQILGHGHSHGGSGHGHSHGGSGHGHSHGGASVAKENHGHSNGHGHSHGEAASATKKKKKVKAANGHGHSHGGSDHESDHGHGHGHGDVELGNGSKKSDKTKSHQLENLNIQAAYIHALGDFLQSIGVCIAGALIWYNPSWQIADPIATFLFSVLVLGTTIGIVKSSVHVLMEGTPEGIDATEIEQGLRACPSIVTTHDLHIWSLSAGLPSLSVHVISDDTEVALHEAQEYLLSQGITHTTIQVERPSTMYPNDCAVGLSCGQDSPHHD
jgi:solute carrier family 30 (zinc transporter), member 2